MKRNWAKAIGWTVLGVVIFVLVVVTGGYLFLQSSAFKRFALAKIAVAADSATGGKTHVGNMDFSLSDLTASLYDITLRGTEPDNQPPLLHADKLTVRLKIVSLLHRQVSLSELVMEHPVVNVQVSREGTSNLPQAPPSQSSSRTNVFDLAVGHAQLTNGEVTYNDRKTPLDANLYDLTTDIRFHEFPKRYDGSLSYKNGQIVYANHSPLPHDLTLQFTADPDKLTVPSALLRVGESNVSLQAQITNYSNPVADGSYQIRIHTQDFAEFASGARPAGDVLLTGDLHYQTQPNQPFLRSVTVNGRIASDALAAAASGRRLEVKQLNGEYRLAGGNLTVSNLNLESLGGRVVANAEMKHLDSTPESAIRASLSGISLRALQNVSGAQAIPQAAVSGTVSGTVEAGWQGTMDKLKARSDLTVNARAESKANRSAEVPVNGAIHVAYDGSSGRIEVHDTTLRMPSASLTAQGTIGNNSRLQVQMVADDLHQLVVLASSFRPGQNEPPAVSGSATMTLVVQGSLKKPSIAGQLNAQHLEVEGSEWTSAKLALRADPSQLAITNGTLVNAHKGQASFNGGVRLQNWSYQPSDPIQARLNAQQLRITDLMAIANQHYPISGELTANLSLSGSEENPAGSGQAQIANANVYGEPLEHLVTNLQASDGTITTTLTAAAKAGTIKANLSYTPKTKAYKVQLDAPEIVLQKLRTLQSRNVPVSGSLNASVSGAGTLDDPQLDATVQLPQLQAKGQTIYEMKAQAHVAQHKLDWSLDSRVSQVPIHGQGEISLTGDYNTDGTIDTGAIPIETLLAAVSADVPAGFHGQTELHATVKGPLKDTSRLEAHLSIPVLNANYQSLKLGIPKPIQADYVNSAITLQPAEIEGTDTSLHFQGTIPIQGHAAPTLTAKGTVDLRILKILVPNVSSGGTIALDVHSSGSRDKPGVEGQLQLKDVAMTSADAPVGIEKLNGTLNIANDHVQVSEMTAQMNGGEVTFGGSIALRPSLQFNLAAQSKSVRLLYPTGLRTLLDTNLTFSGNFARSSLSGRVLIDSLSFTPDFDLTKFSDQFSTGATVSQPGFADHVHLAIAVQSGESLNATSSQISVEGQVALQVGGTAANPVITGRTTLTSGELFYRNVRYELQHGFITFDNPNETHPVLNLSVTTTIEQYNLTLTMRGPLDKLTTSYTSDPPLATADVINLVARGKTTQESAASSQSTDSMIASEAASQLSSSVQRLTGLSSLAIDPTMSGNNQDPSARIAIQQRITKNFLFTFSTDVTQPGQEIVQGEYRFNNKWSVSVTRDQLGGLSIDGRYHTRH